jgi:uroporphyrinogen-III synthase
MLPLANRRILVTRAPHQASALADELTHLGAVPILVPTIEIGPPSSFGALDAALGDLAGFDLLIFTSANAVEAFQQRAQNLGVTPTANRIAVVGPSTARALESIGLHPDVIPPMFTADALAATLAPEAAGSRMLLVRAEGAPDVLPNSLTTAGAAVTVAAAYRNRIPDDSIAALASLFTAQADYPDAVTFTSASTAQNLISLLSAAKLTLPETILRASIGPVTSAALRDLNLSPHIEAANPSIQALAAAMAAHFMAVC